MQRIRVTVAFLATICLLTLSACSAPSNTDEREARTVRLVLRNPSGLKADAWPMTAGVPFPKGALTWPSTVALTDEHGDALPVQARVTSTWGPKGSVRWLLLDWQAPLDGAPQTACTLHYAPDVRPRKPRQAVAVREAGPNALEVTTGPLAFEVRRDRFDLIHRAWRVQGGKRAALVEPSGDAGPYFVDGDGTAFRAAGGAPDEVTVEESGPLRAVICAKGWFHSDAGTKCGRYVVRIHAFAGKPFVKVLYTFIVTQESKDARFRDIGLHIPTGASRIAFGGDSSGPHKVGENESVYLLQYDQDRFLVKRGGETAKWEERPQGKRAAGWARVEGERGTMTLACRDLWQQFPKEIEALGGKGITFHVWPAHGVAKPDRKITDAMLQYLWFCHEGTTLDFTVPESYWSHNEGYSEYEYRYVRSAKTANAIGLAKTHELLVWFHDPSEAASVARTAEAWQDEPVCLAEPQWMCASGAFGRLHPVDTTRFPDIEKGLSKAFDCERRLEAHTNDYGMFNLGDGHTTWHMGHKRWHDVYRCWRALHHGAPRVPWLLYVRSGDPKYYRHAVRNARHVMDLDICHHTKPALESLEWPLGKIAGALNDYKGITHWHAGGRLFDYNSMTDFMLTHYYLTGDRRGLDVALEWGEAIKKRFRTPRGSRSGAGVTAALIELYQATSDPEYKRIIDLHVAHMLDKVQNMDGSKVYSTHVTHYWPHKKGQRIPVGAFPEWENYAPWIQRYYDLTGDPRTGERIVAWANAYIEGFGDLCSLWGAKDYVNILAYAYHVSRDERFLAHGLRVMNHYIESIEDSPGTLYDGFPHVGQMSHGPGYMAQRIPYFLAALAAAGKPIAPEPPPPQPFGLLFTRRRPEGKKFESVDLLLRQDTDAPFRILATGAMGYDKRPIRVTVKAPSGKAVVEKDIEFDKGPIDLKVDVPADGETGTYRLTIRGEGSFWDIKSPIRTEPVLKQAYPIAGTYVRLPHCRYWFLVPKGVRAFTVSARAPNPERVAFILHDPEGILAAKASVRPTSERPPCVVRIEPKPQHTGKLWLLQGRAGFVELTLEAEGAPMPPYLATEPDLFFVPPKE